MDLLDSIKGRRSVRHFTDERPPRELIAECIEAATWAPSPTNQQPWEFVVAAGEALAKIAGVVAETFPRRMKEVDPYRGIPEACKTRKDETFARLFAAAKQEGLDPKSLFQKNMNFYDAPVAVLFVAFKMEGDLFRAATTAALENFLLAAHARGLGTCWISTVAACREELGAALEISADREILDGVALGYPAEGMPLNDMPRDRLPVEQVTTWLGL
ncbi:nitroreductase family protein [Thermodesulfobacteriota bacterium]